MEAATAPAAVPLFQAKPPTNGTKQAAARKEYTEFRSPRMLLADRARAVEVAMKPILTPSVIFFNWASVGFFFSVPCQISRVNTVDIVIRPQSMVDMQAARTAAMISAQTMAGSSIRMTSKNALFPEAPYLKEP